MKTWSIIAGNKDEIVNHMIELTKPTREWYNNDSTQYLYGEDGMKKQVESIIEKNKGCGIVFYLTLDEKAITKEEMNLKLMSQYVHIREDVDLKLGEPLPHTEKSKI